MEITSLLKGTTFEDAKTILKSDPYFLSVYEDESYPDIFLVHFTRKSDMNLQIVISSKGLILSKETYIPVAYGHDCVKHFPNESYINNDLKDSKILPCVDGTQLLLYYNNNRWQLSTNRRIDANKSKFSSSWTFGQMFWDMAKKMDMDSLDKGNSYMFVVQHCFNPTVVSLNGDVSGSDNKLWHVGTRKLDSLQLIDCSIEGTVTPTEIVNTFETVTDIEEAAKKLSIDDIGYLIVNKLGQMTVVLGEEYKLAMQLRGNSNDLTYRCLVMLMNNKKDEFLKTFPTCQPTFIWLESNLEAWSQAYFKLYRQKFIFRKQIPQLEYADFMILKHLHKDYFESGESKEERIRHSPKTVYQKLLKYSPKRLHTILSRSTHEILSGLKDASEEQDKYVHSGENALNTE